MATPDYILYGNGLYLPRGYEIAPPPPQHQVSFFAYAEVGMAIPQLAIDYDPIVPFWWLEDEVYELHNVMAYLDQYEAQLMDHVEDLLMRIPNIDARFDYESDLAWQREVTEARIDYYDKLGL